MSVQVRPFRDAADARAIAAEASIEERIGLTTCVADAVARRAVDRPGGTAVTVIDAAGDEVEIVTNAELARRVAAAAAGLGRLGVDGVVGYLLPNVIETVVLLLAASRVGSVCPINPYLRADQIAAILQAAGVRVLVAAGPDIDAAIWDTARQVCNHLPGLQLVVVGTDPGQGLPWADLVAERPVTEAFDTVGSPPASELAALFHTGGTTGTPKLVRITHRNQLANSHMIRLGLGIEPTDVVAVVLPLFHVAAVHLAVLGPLVAGAELVLLAPQGLRSREAVGAYWRMVERFRISVMSLVPTLASRLATVPIESDLSSLRIVNCGAAPLTSAAQVSFEEHTGIPMLEGFGLTEATASCLLNPRDGIRRRGSAGVPVPYQEARIAEVDGDGRVLGDCPPGVVGHLLLRGPNVSPGYLDGPSERHEGWLDTKDLARQDAEGYIWIVGRDKDIIIRGGHNISARDVEEALVGHPAVADVASVAMPHPDLGEVPVAYVAMRPGADALEADLIAYAETHVADRACVPARVFVIDALPTTAVGKIFKPTLELDAVKVAIREVLADLPGAEAVAQTATSNARAGGFEARIGPDSRRAGEETLLVQRLDRIRVRAVFEAAREETP